MRRFFGQAYENNIQKIIAKERAEAEKKIIE
jgi:hypothetical protein